MSPPAAWDPMEIETPVGPARLTPYVVDGARGLLLLGHGAGGGIGATDLVATMETAVALGVTVGLVEQPYRVAGKRAAAPAPRLDTAWLAVVAATRERFGDTLPLFVGGRSSGARVACRTAGEVGATGVICLAFPLHPPGKPEKTRLPELEGVPNGVPVLIVQGEKDPFGMPPAADGREVVVIAGTHSLKAKGPVAAAVSPWLAAQL